MPGPKLTALENQAWSGFLRTHERVWRAMESGLSQVGLSMAEYDVLIALHQAGTDGLRMSDLAQRRLMSTGGITRLADRLEGRGLIARRRSAADGRSLTAALTAAGSTLLRRAGRLHQDGIREQFLSRLDDEQLRHLAAIWAVLEPATPPHDPPTG